MKGRRLGVRVFRGADRAPRLPPRAKDRSRAVFRRFLDVAAFLRAREHPTSPGPEQASGFGSPQAPRQGAGGADVVVVVVAPGRSAVRAYSLAFAARAPVRGCATARGAHTAGNRRATVSSGIAARILRHIRRRLHPDGLDVVRDRWRTRRSVAPECAAQGVHEHVLILAPAHHRCEGSSDGRSSEIFLERLASHLLTHFSEGTLKTRASSKGRGTSEARQRATRRAHPPTHLPRDLLEP